MIETLFSEANPVSQIVLISTRADLQGLLLLFLYGGLIYGLIAYLCRHESYDAGVAIGAIIIITDVLSYEGKKLILNFIQNFLM